MASGRSDPYNRQAIRKSKSKGENTMRLVQNIVAISVAVIIVCAIMIPILDSSEDLRHTGEAGSDRNTAPSVYLDEYQGTEDITITMSAGTPDVSVPGLTRIVTQSQCITIDGNTVSITRNGQSPMTMTDGNTVTIDVSEENMVLIDADTDGAYGLYDDFSTPIYVQSSSRLIAMDQASPFFSYQTVSGNQIHIAYQPYQDHNGIVGITAVGTDGSIIAPIQYAWNGSGPMDETMDMILDIIPLLVVIGILMSCVYMFTSGRGF